MRALLCLVLSLGMALAADRTVLCYGDSITYGDFKEQGVGAGTRWVDLLPGLVLGIRTINAGKNGRTTADADGLGKALDGARPGPDVVIIMLGVNDLKNVTNGDQALAACVANAGKLLDVAAAKAPQAQIVLCAPPTINLQTLNGYWKGKGFGAKTAEVLARLPAAYATLAQARKLRSASMLQSVTPANLADGVHPNAAGHAELAKAVAAALAAPAAQAAPAGKAR
jgi:lysophospholipase L1-like esterase